MGTCGSLSLVKYYPKSQLCPIPKSSFSSIYPNLRFPSVNSRPRRQTQIQLRFNSGENDPNQNTSNYFQDIKGRFRRRRWWSDEDSSPDQPPGILDQIIDSSYILKILSCYGWGLPIILLSLLLASGPKAFLMSMAFPIGESAITFTFKKLSDSSLFSSSSAAPKRRTKTYKKKNKKNKAQPNSANLEVEDEMDEKEEQAQNPSNFRGWD